MNITIPPSALSLGGAGFRGGCAGFRGGGATGRQRHREKFIPGGTMRITMPPNAPSFSGAGFRGGAVRQGGSTTRKLCRRRYNEHNDAAERSVLGRRGLSPRRKKKGIGKPVRAFLCLFCGQRPHRAAAGSYNCHSVFPPPVIFATPAYTAPQGHTTVIRYCRRP